jgi:hypothetical protein
LKGPPLPEDYQPKSWDDLQKLVGRYILLTSLWSSSSTDTYKVIVDAGVLKGIYDRVRAMTKGDMIVNVRRGQHAYGRLCVLQKEITLDPSQEHYGLPQEEKANPDMKSTIWATQIFMTVNPLTNLEAAFQQPKWERKKITTAAAYKKYGAKMSPEEKTLTDIFQATNNKIIDCMKLEQYRTIMQAFWADNTENRIPLMQGETIWNMVTMKAMLITMLSTEYDIFFQKIPTKMSCFERTQRFMNVFKWYKNWFMDRKCMASNQFVQKYERMLEKNAIQPAQFNGMPTHYADHSGITDTAWVRTEPEFDSDAKNKVIEKISVEKGPGVSVEIQEERVRKQVEERMKKLE